MPIGWGLAENRQWAGPRLEEARVEETYIGQRAHSAIQYQKPSFNTYYSCPFSQSRNLKPSSLRKPSVGGVGAVTGFVISNIYRSLPPGPICLLSSLRAPRKTRMHVGKKKKNAASLNNFFVWLFKPESPTETFLQKCSLPTEKRGYTFERSPVVIFSICYSTV